MFNNIIHWFESIDPILAAFYATVFHLGFDSIGCVFRFLIPHHESDGIRWNVGIYWWRHDSSEFLEPIISGYRHEYWNRIY
jgi:hypothetical protein